MSEENPPRQKITYLQHLRRLRQNVRPTETAQLLSTAASAACSAALAYALLMGHPVELASGSADAIAIPIAAVLIASVQAFRGQRQLRRTVWRCELACDEQALLHEHTEREALLADEDLLRLCWKASLLSRRYPATDRNMAGFLEAYRQLLAQYPLLASLGQSRFYVQRMILQADKGLGLDDAPAGDH